MISENDIAADLQREFIATSQDEKDYLFHIARYLYKKYIVPLEAQVPKKPTPNKNTPPPPKLEKRPGALWNNSRIREQKFEGDIAAMKKNGIATIVHDNPNGW